MPTKQTVWRTGAVIVAFFVLCSTGLLLFVDLIANSVVKPALLRAVATAYPQYDIQCGNVTVGILSRRVTCDAIAVAARDSSWLVRGGDFAVSGISWWRLFWKGKAAPEEFACLVIESQGGTLLLPGPAYEVHYDSLRVSVADSVVAFDSLTLFPSREDEVLFASRPFRQTRLRLAVPRAVGSGVACLDLLQGKGYRARSVRLQDPIIETLLNKDKPSFIDTIDPMMPADLFALIGRDVQVDSLSITNGQLRYGERYVVGGRPGVISLDSMQVGVERSVQPPGRGDTLTLLASGRFMNAGDMMITMMIPTGHRELSYKYSGSIGRMGFASLNAFLERTEHIRITGGVLHEAFFDITVTAGSARGSVRAFYRDLTIAKIDGRTGSEEGILDRIASLIGNRITLRGTNMPDRTGNTTIGKVRYEHRKNQAFLEFSWFALRSGVGDVVGF